MLLSWKQLHCRARHLAFRRSKKKTPQIINQFLYYIYTLYLPDRYFRLMRNCKKKGNQRSS